MKQKPGPAGAVLIRFDTAASSVNKMKEYGGNPSLAAGHEASHHPLVASRRGFDPGVGSSFNKTGQQLNPDGVAALAKDWIQALALPMHSSIGPR
ncbi:hypothetical protein FQK07_04790 [Synechococcus sp. BSF8S]|nr:hypothetical protein [Synechococcus sp. BSF8S]